jgi:long-chain acyl-CoA synthetase
MQKRTLFRLLRETAQSHPDSIFMTERHAAGWVGASFRQIAEESRRVAGFLLEAGLQRGDRVTLLAEGRNSWMAAELGIFFAGGISVPISVKIKEKSEIGFRVSHSQSRFAITSERYAEKIRGLASELPDLKGLLVMDPVVPASGALPVWPWAEVLERGGAFAEAHPEMLAAIEESASENDPVTLTYTSGTIAEPKGILLSHVNYWVNVEQADIMFPLAPPNSMLLIIPWDHSFGHTAGLFLFLKKASLIAAVETAATEIGTIRNIPKNIKEIGPSYLLVVPALVENFRRTIATQARQKGFLSAALFSATIALGTRVNGDAYRTRHDPLSLLAWPLYLLLRGAVSSKIRRSLGGRLVFMVSGGSACSTEHVRWFTALGIPLYQGYGLSETSPIISSNSNVPGNFKIGSSGRPFPWAKVSILREDGAVLPAGQTGEICVAGECVMRGYWRNEAATREAMAGGLFHTGDLGYLDADGFLYVVGRIKSLLVGSNGEKYSPEALEQHIVDTVPLVSQVVLYNQQNPFTVALVVPEMGGVKDLLRAHVISGATDAQLDQVLEALRLDLMRYRKDPALTSLFVSDWTPKTFALLPEAFCESNGMMNASMKIVRRAVVSRYRNRIEKLYGEEEDPLNGTNREVLRSLLDAAP